MAPVGTAGRSRTTLTGEHPAVGREPAAPPASSRRKPSWRRRLASVAAVVLLMVLGYFAVTFVQVWRASTWDGTKSSDAIVVLGAAQYDGRPSPVLEARLQHALMLYQQGVAPVIVVTGGRMEGDTYTEATSGYNWLRARGVPDEAILKEVQGRSTYESLRATARFLDERDVDDVILVSDGYHALRVDGTAREVGLDPQVSVVSTGDASITELGRETLGVGVGRVVGYGRLSRLTG